MRPDTEVLHGNSLEVLKKVLLKNALVKQGALGGARGRIAHDQEPRKGFLLEGGFCKHVHLLWLSGRQNVLLGPHPCVFVWETDFLNSSGTEVLKGSPQNVQPHRQWCIKILLLWAQKCYTPLALGSGSKCPWQFFP